MRRSTAKQYDSQPVEDVINPLDGRRTRRINSQDNPRTRNAGFEWTPSQELELQRARRLQQANQTPSSSTRRSADIYLAGIRENYEMIHERFGGFRPGYMASTSSSSVTNQSERASTDSRASEPHAPVRPDPPVRPLRIIPEDFLRERRERIARQGQELWEERRRERAARENSSTQESGYCSKRGSDRSD